MFFGNFFTLIHTQSIKFLRKFFKNDLGHDITLLLKPFECKLTNYFNRNLSLKFYQNIENMPF